MRLPDGRGNLSRNIATLNESPFGLRQLPRVFNELLLSKPLGHGLKRLAVEPFILRLPAVMRVTSNSL